MISWLACLSWSSAQKAADPQAGNSGSNGRLEVGGMLDCSGDLVWTAFRLQLSQELVAAAYAGRRKIADREVRLQRLDPEFVAAAQALTSATEDGGLANGVGQFYEDLCGDADRSFCLYGAVAALFIVAADLHASSEHFGASQQYLGTATYLLGSQHSLDFVESTHWPIRANDLLLNVNRSRVEPFVITVSSAFAAAESLGIDVVASLVGTGIDKGSWDSELSAEKLAPPSSSLYPWGVQDLAAALASAVMCHRHAAPSLVRLLPVGTHPTLLLEAVTMLRDFAFGPGQHVEVSRALGVGYKCAVFPDMCRGGDFGDDPVAELIGPFDAPASYGSFTLGRITQALRSVAASLRDKFMESQPTALICTSPFIVCAVLQEALSIPMLGFLGLPLLWKRPTDHFENADVRAKFWGLLDQLWTRPDVVLVTNNPLLAEQIAHQATGVQPPVVRPHAVFANASYAPTRNKEALLVSRTKFLWVTLGCAIRKHFVPAGYPVDFVVANSDSKMGFQEMAAFRATVLVPWEHALMAFFEFYSMAVPLLMPEAEWAASRLVFDPEGNLGSTTSAYVDVSPLCDPGVGCAPGRHQFHPFMFSSVASRLYWYRYSSFAQFPHIHRFSSIPHLLERLVTIDVAATSRAMKEFNDLTLVRSTAFWRQAASKLLTGHSACRAGVDSSAWASAAAIPRAV